MEATVLFGNCFICDGLEDQAISAFSSTVKLYPGALEPLLFLAKAYLKRMNFSTAESYIRLALRQSDVDPYVWNEMGALCLRQNQLSDAIESFEKARALLEKAKVDQYEEPWISVRYNLAQTYRLAS